MNVLHYFFNAEQLNRLFPYYILITNNGLQVEAYGSALSNIITLEAHDSFTNVFNIAGKDNANNLSAYIGRSLTLSPFSHPDLFIQGQLEYLQSTDQYLFAGSTITGTGNDANGSNGAITVLKHRLDFYQDVLDEVPADIVVFDTEHRYLYINRTAIKDASLRERMIGLKDEDFCWLTNRPESLAQERRANFNEVMQTRRLKRWEEVIYGRDGEVYHKLRHMYPVLGHGGQVKLVIGYGIDITDRKRAEEQLQLNEKKYRELYTLSPALIYTHNMQGNILTVNPAISQILGFAEREVIGKNIKQLLPVYDQKKLSREYLDKLNLHGNARGICRALHRNGKDIVYLFYQSYVAGVEPDEKYIIGFSHDITDRINIEKELRAAKNTTENAAKAKEVFLANLSHEIRTPMNGILGVNKLLAKTQLTEQQQGYTSLIAESADSLLAIVNDILDIEKITSNQLELESRAFNISNKIGRTLQLFQFKAKQKDISLVLQNRLPEEFTVIGDESRFAQILSNLISNSIKFTKTGGITVTASLLYNASDKVLLEFSIADTGIGISQDRLPFIFDPFMRPSSNLTRQHGGTGMGLAIVKSLVELQGGHIKVNSKVNEGTEFVFSLTLKKGLAYTQRYNGNESQSEPYKLQGKHVLVAEDVELNQFLIKTLLESWGCVVDVVEDGAKAVAKARDNFYDFVLMDIQMPEMDGLTATRHIRQFENARFSEVPIIALTANALKGDGKYYMDAGMNDCVTKPYSDEHLYEKIIDVLNKNKDRAEDNATPVFNAVVAPDAPVAATEEIILPMDNDVKMYDLTMIESIGKGNQEFTNKMIAMFCDITAQDVNKIKDAAAAGDWKTVAAIAHKLKSTVGNMGVDALKEPIRELELGQAADADATINFVIEKLEQVKAQLKAHYPAAFIK